MLFGVPYDQAADMPLDLAVALLNDERLDNTHQRPPKVTLRNHQRLQLRHLKMKVQLLLQWVENIQNQRDSK